MTIRLTNKTFFVFDLDDTLYQEVDFLKSAYRAIAKDLSAPLSIDVYEEMWQYYREGKNVFATLLDKYSDRLQGVTVQHLIKNYREHVPDIALAEDVKAFLELLHSKKVNMGLITDGRSLTQRNKLKALGIEHLFRDILISEEFGSEKPEKKNYLHFQNKYPDSQFYSVGDNTRKDFIVPLELGWEIICIKDIGTNIHKQDFSNSVSLPKYVIDSFAEIEFI